LHFAEHMEAAEIGPNEVLDDYRIQGRVEFVAATMLAYLERACERKLIEEATRFVENPCFHDKEKSNMMRMRDRMVKELFDKLGPNEDQDTFVLEVGLYWGTESVITIHQLPNWRGSEEIKLVSIVSFQVCPSPNGHTTATDMGGSQSEKLTPNG
ncbi:hypothetical protein Tco_0301100, partial [Tanacetum coccineum]